MTMVVADKYFAFIGNGSLLGSKIITLSYELLDDAERIAKTIPNIKLSDNPSFMNHYAASLFFPHTQHDSIPTFITRFNDPGATCRIVGEMRHAR